MFDPRAEGDALLSRREEVFPSAPTILQVRIAKLSYFVLGSGLLAPWNAFLTAADYFNAIYGTHIDRLFTVCYLPLCFLLLILMLHYGPEVAHPHTRITVCYIGFLLLTAMVPLVDTILVRDNEQAPSSALSLVLMFVLITGILDGTCQGAVFVDAAKSGTMYTHAVVAGTAFSGVIVCALRIWTKALWQSDLRKGTTLYFASASLLSAAGLAAHVFVLPRLGIRPSVASRSHRIEIPMNQFQGTQGIRSGAVHNADIDDNDLMDEPVTQAIFFDYRRNQYSSVQMDSEIESEVEGAPKSTRKGMEPSTGRKASLLEVHQDSQAMQLRYSHMRLVAGYGWPVFLSLFLTYVATLSVFPGVLAEDVHSDALGSWYPIILFAAFNVSDVVGKLIPISPQFWLQSRYLILIASITRIILLFPALIWAVSYGASVLVIGSVTIGLGLTNGYLTAITMTLAPGFVAKSCQIYHFSQTDVSSSSSPQLPVSRPCHANEHVSHPRTLTTQESNELAEDLCVVCLVIGLMIGAFLGWLWLLVPTPLGVPHLL